MKGIQFLFPWKQKRGRFENKLDSFHQISCNFVGISTVVCGSFWGGGGGGKKLKMGAGAMVTKGQKMLNSPQTSKSLRCFMKFDDRNQFFLIPPFFISMVAMEIKKGG
jgi:hypothetical protein